MNRYLYTYMNNNGVYRWTDWTNEKWEECKSKINKFYGIGFPKLIRTETEVEEIEHAEAN